MGIDRIGSKGPSPAPPAGVDATAPTAKAGKPFDVGSTAPAAPAGQVASPSGALEQLRSGAITLDRYLDIKVDEACAHLPLPRAAQGTIRTALRERLASDPTLVDLVRTATGAPPPPIPDE